MLRFRDGLLQNEKEKVESQQMNGLYPLMTAFPTKFNRTTNRGCMRINQMFPPDKYYEKEWEAQEIVIAVSDLPRFLLWILNVNTLLCVSSIVLLSDVSVERNV